MTYLLDYAGCM